MVITPAMQAENVPGYSIDLDPESFKFVAAPIMENHGPTYTGTLAGAIRFVGAEQGWDPVDVADTLARNEC